MERCALCPSVNACIPADGPQQQGGLLFIGEAPGFQEDRSAKKHPPGRPFVGKTGEEVDRHYLPLAGLKRSQTLFTNAIACLPTTSGGKLDPKRAADLALLDCCATKHLYPLIERMQPSVIVPMGSFACRAVCPDIDLELHHGIPTTTPWGIPAFPSYPPALAMHEPKKMLYVRTDWHRFRRYLSGSLLQPVDAYPNPDYAEVESVKEIRALVPTAAMACDTESSREGPFCLTYSQQPGTGRLIRATRLDLLDALQAQLDRWRAPLLFHNWMYDWPVTEAMGLRFPHRRMVDTMVRAYQLGNLPQGLKALGFRELGMAMQDFEDLVSPYSTERVLAYYRAALMEDWPKPEPTMVRDPEGKWKVYKAQGMGTKLKRFFADYNKSHGTKDVFSAWENWQPSHPLMEERLGPWPGMDIRHVPIDKVIYYASRDPDTVLRLWPILKRMAAVVRHVSQENWREKAA